MRGFVVSATWEPRAGFTPTADETRRRRAIDGTRIWRHPKVAVETVPDPIVETPDDHSAGFRDNRCRRRRHSMKRLGRVIEIAYRALLLASDESSFMTGAQLVIDGGYTVP